MHAAMLRAALLPIVIVITACPRTPAPEPAPSPVSASESMAAAEEAKYRARADSLRRVILSHAEWVDIAADSCNPGTFRSFRRDNADTTVVTRAMESLERAIVVSGVDQPLTDRASHDLMRTVIAWEADLARPNWDVSGNEPPRRAMAPGLGGEFLNETTGVCDRYVPLDGLTFVIPDIGAFTPPPFRPGQVDIVQGDSGLMAARDKFSATHDEADPIFTYTRIAPIVVWGDYGLVTVNRPAEVKGVRSLDTGVGGATYIFHRVRNEWRLLAILRTWS